MMYEDFLSKKTKFFKGTGFVVDDSDLNRVLFQFQKDFTRFALKKGRAAIFAGTGLGKTLMEIEWGQQVIKYKDGSVLIVTPLAVAEQTAKMARDIMGIEAKVIASNSDIIEGINITNYDKLHRIDLNRFIGIIFDESSIFKGGGEIYRQACEKTAKHDYILCASATPAPNDYTEFGRHSELLRIMKYREMKDRFFIKKGDLNKELKLKGHAEDAFWKWITSWALICRHPADLDYVEDRYKLPPLKVQWIEIESSVQALPGELFKRKAITLHERQKARALTYREKIRKAEEIINQSPDEPWIFWVNRNCEGDYIEKSLTGFTQVKGNEKPERKVEYLMGFNSGKYQKLVTKPTIAGHGMNWQHCSKIIFFPTDSYEQYVQALARCWRFGQEKTVYVYVITADIEGNIKENMMDKERKNDEMYNKLIMRAKKHEKESLGLIEVHDDYFPEKPMRLPIWLKGE